jgi:hypothetical protein
MNINVNNGISKYNPTDRPDYFSYLGYLLLRGHLDNKLYNENKVHRLWTILYSNDIIARNYKANYTEFLLRSSIIPYSITINNALDIIKYIKIVDMTESIIYRLNRVCTLHEYITGILSGKYKMYRLIQEEHEYRSKLWVFHIPRKQLQLILKIKRYSMIM